MVKHTFLLELRKAHNLSQAFVAKNIEVSRQSYMEIEKGAKELTLSQAQKIAGIFNISLEALIAGKKISDIKVSFDKEKKKEEVQEVRIDVPQKNIKKFKEVLLYILEKVGSKSNVGMTVLYKLLYFIDFDFYEKYEEQLIGATYIKNHFGPTPVEFKKVIDDMKKKDEIEEVKSHYFKLRNLRRLPALSVSKGRRSQGRWGVQRGAMQCSPLVAVRAGFPRRRNQSRKQSRPPACPELVQWAAELLNKKQAPLFSLFLLNFLDFCFSIYLFSVWLVTTFFRVIYDKKTASAYFIN